MTESLGRLEPVPVRTVWPLEAHDFTPWLAQPENLALLAETLRLGELSNARTEVSVGNFSIDILAKDDEGNTVVIENQFGPTDHTHLGQILTYVGGQEGKATTVVWIAESFRDEHRAAIDWLNASTLPDFDFFAVEVEVFKIGTSTPAPHFNVVAYPNNWSRRIAVVTRSGGDGEQEREYIAFWSGFGALLKERGAPFQIDPAPNTNYCDFRIGRAGCRFLVRAGGRGNRLGLELQMESTDSKPMFDALFSQKREIEAEFGEPLEWLRLDDQIRSKIRIETTEFNPSERSEWPKQYAWLFDRLLKFNKVFRDRVRNFRPDDATPQAQAAAP